MAKAKARLSIPAPVAQHLPGALVAVMLVLFCLPHAPHLPLLDQLPQGFAAYHARSWFVAAIAVAAWAALLVANARLVRWKSMAGLGVIAFLVLTAWTLLSITWADFSRHLAWEEAARTAMYAAAFVCGVGSLPSSAAVIRMMRWMGGGFALSALLTMIAFLATDDALPLFSFGRAADPVGYPNGLAAFCAVGCLVLLGVAGRKDQIDDQKTRAATWSSVILAGERSLALAGVSLLASLGIMAQSRAALPAMLISIVVAFAMTPRRWTLLAQTALIAGANALAWKKLNAPFARLDDLARAQWDEKGVKDAAATAATATNDAGAAAIGIAIAVALIAASATLAMSYVRREFGSSWIPWAPQKIVRTSTIAFAAAAGIALVLFLVVAGGRSADWVSGQWKACRSAQAFVEATGPRTSHFGEFGTGRCDYWRVAWQNTLKHPLTGVGAANFQRSYVVERRVGEHPKQAHSIELQFLGELGVPGFLLACLVLASVFWGAWRYLLSGAGRDPSFALGIAAFVYWGVHASVDWIWNLPMVTIPVMIFMGGLAGCVCPPQKIMERTPRFLMGVGVVFVALALILPIGMADLALSKAKKTDLVESDPKAALKWAEKASSYDATWAEPYLVQAEINSLLKRKSEAVRAAAHAVRLEPESWVAWFRAGLVVRASGRPEKQWRRFMYNAARLNPRIETETAGAVVIEKSKVKTGAATSDDEGRKRADAFANQQEPQ